MFQILVGISDQSIKGITEEINWVLGSLVGDTDALLLNDLEYDDVAWGYKHATKHWRTEGK